MTYRNETVVRPVIHPGANSFSTRRDFLTVAMAVGAAAGLAGVIPAAMAMGKPVANRPQKGLKVLILGGTGFLGPAIVDVCKARGHSVTLFNRGKTEKRIGVIEDVEKLNGNRDPNKHAEETDETTPKGLSQIEDAIKNGAKWDAVVDTSGYVPRIVKASAEVVAPAAGQYVFISTISVYAHNDRIDEDETGELATTDQPENENPMAPGMYGPLKALCEQAAEKAMPGKVVTIRPGFIVGPGDPSDRFTYWPVRAAGMGCVEGAKWGDKMLAPGAPEDPIQFIDVRDLAEFTVQCIEQKHMGFFNATGPEKPMPVGEFMSACVAAAKDVKKVETKLEWVSWDFIDKLNDEKYSTSPIDTTIVIPPSGEVAAFHRRNVSKAVKAGLKFRPTVDTCKDTIVWWSKEVARRDRVGKQMVEDAKKAEKPAPNLPPAEKLRVGMTPDREAEVLKAWDERAK